MTGKTARAGFFLLTAILIWTARTDIATGQESVQIDTFSPLGIVSRVRQVRARFSEPMVPFGDPGATDPFLIDCDEKGQGRWADSQNWIFDFDRDLPAGVKGEFTLKPGLKSLSGRPVHDPGVFSFSTGRPMILDVWPADRHGAVIVEDQAFVLHFNGTLEEDFVLDNTRFSVDGIRHLIQANLIRGTRREKILDALRDGHWYGRQDVDTNRVFIVQPRQIFPGDTPIRLIWGTGEKQTPDKVDSRTRILTYRTRKPFSASFGCARENADKGCIPTLPMRVFFSSPIPADTADRILIKGEDGTVYQRKKLPFTEGRERPEQIYEAVFEGPFPENRSFTVMLPENIRDEVGRRLINQNRFPLKIKTAEAPPLAKFPARFGVIEKNGTNGDTPPLLPVTLRKAGVANPDYPSETGRILTVDKKNRAEMIQWLRKLASTNRNQSILGDDPKAEPFALPRPMGRDDLEVAGIPLPRSGLTVVELESRALGASLLGENRPMYVPAAALVTNLSAHLKRGNASSLVWVTALDTGRPVENADVVVCDCAGKDIRRGRTDADGIVHIPGNLNDEPPLCEIDGDSDAYMDASQMNALWGMDGGYFVFVETPEDMTFVHSSWDEGIEPWRYGLPHEGRGKGDIAHTVLDRSLFRAGDTVHMKHLLRQPTMSGFALPDPRNRPASVVVKHEGSGRWQAVDLEWDSSGTARSDWEIPGHAEMGLYHIGLFDKPGALLKDPDVAFFPDADFEGTWIPSGSFRVEEFRVPLIRAVIQPPLKPLVQARTADLDISLSYLSGGGVGHAEVRLREELRDRYVAFPLWEGYVFGAEEIRETRIIREDGPDAPSPEPRVSTRDLTLDETGSLRATLDLPEVNKPSDLVTELEFSDPNGEIQTISARLPLWPSEWVLGIKPDHWISLKNKVKFVAALLDLEGRPISGVPVSIDIFQTTRYSHRKRLTGGFYAFENTTQTRHVHALSTVQTDAHGMVACEESVPFSGQLTVQVSALDPSGNRTVTHCDLWVRGEEDQWLGGSDSDRIDLIPEKKRWEPGETARFQVRMPFAEATVLTTVEREGILDSYVNRVSSGSPIIELPIKGNYAPNVFVSALCVRGRIQGPLPTAMVDLGKPAFKLGIAEIDVGWKTHELRVSVLPEKTVYQAKETAKARIRVVTAAGTPLPDDAEAAVAVVDQGLLELMPNPSWNILAAMMGRRPYQVHTATAGMQVVGKRHYGLKARPAGGGGGKQPTRELFDTLVLWQARVPLDRNGGADIDIPLNDSATGFRIVAAVNAGAGLFGTGEADIRSTRPLMILPAIPPVIREKDTFQAGFTIRNTSDRPMEVRVSGKVSGGLPKDPDPGNPDPRYPDMTLEPTDLSLNPGESRELQWPVTAPMNIAELVYEIHALEMDAAEDRKPDEKSEKNAADTVRIRQKVAETVPAGVFQATLTQAVSPVSVTVEKPAHALPHKGGVRISLKPGLSDDLDGVVAYMRQYPYTCMEQKFSRAVVLDDPQLLRDAKNDLAGCLDRHGLVKFFPTLDQGSELLTAYIYGVSHEAGVSLPGPVREKMETGLLDFVQGRVTGLPRTGSIDMAVRRIMVLEALSRTGKIYPGLLESISIQPDQWPTAAVVDWVSLLTRTSDLLPDQKERIRQAEGILRSRMDFQGTRMGFASSLDEGIGHFQASADVTALKAVLALMPLKSFAPDMPRLIRGALDRRIRGRWDTTPANAWGVLVMKRFAQTFEPNPVSGVTRMELGHARQAADWKADPGGGDFLFPLPDRADTLSVIHEGEGRPWVSITSLAARPLNEPISSGYHIKKSLTPVQQARPGRWCKGDVIRVRLDLEAQADASWVVVNDPVPAGTTLLGTGLGRDSRILVRTGDPEAANLYPVFVERRFEGFRAYYEHAPKGTWFVEYALRLNHPGRFHVPGTRVEALYAPEMSGEIPNPVFEIDP